jgi:uncharacterized membrane protein (UPF0182 family)
MDPELVAHLRYPEDMFSVQTNMYGLYHMTDAASFYNKTDAWDIAQSPGAVGNAQAVAPVIGPQGVTTAREPRMIPYYLQMRLPEEQREDFLILQPFVPFSKDDSRKDLTAFMIAKSGPNDYGQLEAFVMPRQQQIDGPALVNARINQQPDISREITLLNTSGSKVILGNLLLIPVEKSLLYVRPLYVQSEATPLPQLKRVIVVFADQVVMRNSLKEALTAIFGSAPTTLEQPANTGGAGSSGAPTAPSPTTPAPTTPGPTVAPNVADLLGQASTHFDAAQAALAAGDLAGYQKETNTARDLVRQANDALKATGGGAATPSPPTSTAPA